MRLAIHGSILLLLLMAGCTPQVQITQGGYRAEYIVEIQSCHARWSSAASEMGKDDSVQIYVSGQQPLGKKYRVTVEEVK